MMIIISDSDNEDSDEIWEPMSDNNLMEEELDVLKGSMTFLASSYWVKFE